MSAEISFLPKEMVPTHPEFYVWWTGTLGQAEWLITHSKALNGKAIAKECSKDLATLPEKIRPLMALEQPDLLVTSSELKILISIEITEQQEFGTNAQQRVARFWSAVANKIPSAYLLPIESYQIEKATEADKRIILEKNLKKRNLLLTAATLPNINGNQLWEQGINDFDGLLQLVKKDKQYANTNLQDFVRKHIEQSGDVNHLKNIDGQEYIHQVGENLYKVYLRTPKVTSSMLLKWFWKCSEVVPTHTFKLQSLYENVFRTNGLSHTVHDELNPHLSYRNLPPAPGKTPIVHKKSKKDEIELFFEMVDSACKQEPIKDLGRENFMEAGEYFPTNIESLWRKDVSKAEEVLESKSEDIRTSGKILLEAINKIASVEDRFAEDLRANKHFNIYKVNCNAKRPLADPYTGALAVRDILFCRNSTDSIHDLGQFKRDENLVFWVNLGETGAQLNNFIYKALNVNYKRLIPKGTAKVPLDQFIELATKCRAEQLSKEIRAHLIFSDYIVVNRNHKKASEIEFLPGLPSLMRLNVLPKDNLLRRSLMIT